LSEKHNSMNAAVELWMKYRKGIYGAKPIPKVQERECSLAFYAGMNAAFWRLSDISDGANDVEEGARRCEEFRVAIKHAAMRTNLDRSDGRS
jgi:hypothetical protein